MKYLILIAGIFSNSVASFLLKLGVSSIDNKSLSGLVFSYLTNVYFVFGGVLYLLAFLLYILALKSFPLNIAHPVLTAGAIGTVSLLSILFLGESFGWKNVIGLIFIISGVIILSKGSQL